MKKFLTLCAAISAATTLFAAERVVWEGNKAISWNTEVYAGEQFETPDGTFTGLLKDDTIKVSVEAKIDEPQYVMTYKAGDSWEWTDLEGINVANGFMTYVVASDEIAQDIADRGIVVRGQGYHAIRIEIGKPESIESSVTNAAIIAPARKIIEAGQVLIIKDGVRYTILGTLVR